MFPSTLVLAGVELIFFTSDHMVLGLEFVTRTVLIAQGLF